MTTAQKQAELLKRFGNKFYNELGERITNGQKMQGRKARTLDSNALELAAQATDSIYKEWIEDESTQDTTAIVS